MRQEEFEQLIKLKQDGKLFKRESTILEFKENFNIGAMPEYAKTFAAFANNSGGVMVFGISDRPRLPVGMKNSNFFKIEIEKVTNFLNEHYSPEIKWSIDDFERDGKKYGVIGINKAIRKPVICRKNTNKGVSYEGDIYYRYSGRSEKIKFPELQQILEETRVNEQNVWMQHIQSIARIGPENVALIDVLRGEIEASDDKKIVIDKTLLKDIQFIQEGRFVEKDGAPALKLLGSVEGIESVVPKINLEDDFYTTTELGEKLGLISEKGSTHYVSVVLNHFKIKNEPKYHQHKNNQNYYTLACLDFLTSKNISIEDAKALAKKKA